MSTYPRGYQRWVIATKARGDEPDVNLVQFATRYRFAGQLQSIELLGATPETAETYLMALRISLAYSALEQLEAFLSKKHIPIRSPECASAFRAQGLSKFRDFLASTSETSLRNRVEKLSKSRGDHDVRPVIEALRHTMFHGRFNPSATSLRSKAGRSFLSDLEHALFERLDDFAEATFADQRRPRANPS